MANEKITELEPLSAGSVAEADVLVIVDISDTSESITGQTKKITQGAIFDSGTSMPNLVEVGTITTGTWNGTTMGVVYGGTGLTSLTSGDILYATGSTTLAKLAKGSDGDTLTLASGAPAWSATTGDITAVEAGTNLNGGGTSGAVTLNLDATIVDLTSVTSTVFVGGLTGDVNGDVTGDLTGNVTATSVLVDGVVATTQSASDNSTKVATTAYVDTQITAEDLDFAGDSGTGSVDLDGQTFTIATGANLTTAAVDQTLTVNLDATITGLTSVTSTGFTGALTGNADTATALETARTIGGTSFNGTANIVPATITVADTADTSCSVGLFESATGDLAPKSDGGLTYNAGTGILTATGLAGPLTGDVTGDVSGSSGSCTGNAATVTTNANLTGEVTSVGNAATIADDVVDEANLKVSNAPTNGYVLSAQSGDTGGLTWVDNTHAAGTVTSVSGAGTVNGLTLTGTVTSSGSLTLGGTLSGVANSALTNSAVTVGTTAISLGASSTTLAGLTSVTSTGFTGDVTGNVSGTAATVTGATQAAITTCANLTTVGTIGSGIWRGNIVEADFGGTGNNVYTYGDLLFATDTTTLDVITIGAGDTDKVLTVASGAPAWVDKEVVAGAGLTGGGTANSVTLNVGAGTGITVADNDVAVATTYAGGSSIVTVGTITTGTWEGTTVAVAKGGTGATSLTDGGILLGSGTGAVTATAVLADGEILIGDGTTDPAVLDVGSSSAITILGTVATGTWNGAAIADEYGGTGQTTYAKGDLLYASDVNTLEKLSVAIDGNVLSLSSGLPSWGSAGSGTVTGSGADNRVAVWSSASAIEGDADFVFDGTNVGIGVTPETDWDSSHSALQVGLTGSLVSGTSATGWTQLMKNARYTGGSTYKYIIEDQATRYVQKNDGTHSFEVAAEGDEDDPITWVETLSIANDGNVKIEKSLGIGLTPTVPLHVSTAAEAGWLSKFQNTGTGGDAHGLLLNAGATNSEFILKCDNAAATVTGLAVTGVGRVGIGTTLPLALLHVQTSDVSVTPNINADNLVVEENGNAGISIISGISSTGNLTWGDTTADMASISYSHSTNDMSFRVNSVNDVMTLDSAGNVGIGTACPGYALEVVGGAYTSTGYLTANNKQIGWRNAADSANHDWILNSSDVLQYRSGGSPLLSIMDSGNVGIGTDVPGEVLEVAGAGSFTSNGTDANSDAAIKIGKWSGGAYGFIQAPSGDDIHIWNSASSDIAVFTNEGRVGIGTAVPSRPLSVVAGATKLSNTGGVLFTNAYSSGSGAVLLGSDFNVGYIQGTNGNGDTANDLSLQTEGGNVGIGVTDPDQALEIDGRLQLSEETSPSAPGSAEGGVFYVKDDGKPYFISALQTEVDLSASAGTSYTAGDGLDLTGTVFSTDLKANGGLVIESEELAVDLGASSITGTLAASDGGTGLTAISTLLNSNTTASDISDFDTEVANNTAVTANTAKTGITSGQASAITANTAKVTNATHTGEVTGSGALTITDDIVDEANLKVSNAPTNGYMLTAQSGDTGGLTWAAASGGGGAAIGTAVTSATEGSILFAGADAGSGGILAQDNDKLFWDDTNERLGIGTAAPSGALHIEGGGFLFNTIAQTDKNFTVASVGEANSIFVEGSNGYVGIATGSPQTELTVEGSITLRELGGARGDTPAYGQLWCKSATRGTAAFFTDDIGTDIPLNTDVLTINMGDITGTGDKGYYYFPKTFTVLELWVTVYGESSTDWDFDVWVDQNVGSPTGMDRFSSILWGSYYPDSVFNDALIKLAGGEWVSDYQSAMTQFAAVLGDDDTADQDYFEVGSDNFMVVNATTAGNALTDCKMFIRGYWTGV